jgi:ABC-type polysaccharide/polyol phosphate export permease
MATFDLSAGTAMPRTGGALWLALRTLRNLHKGLAWAWLDIVCQYRRSKIGPWWETINVVVMTVGMTFVSAAVIGGNVTSLIGYVGLGIVTWTVISTLINDGCSTFIRNREFILGSNLSIDFYVARTIFRTFITFCHHFLLYFIGVAVGIVELHWVGLLAIPGVFLLFLNGYWVVTLFAFICARFRDVELIIRNLLQLAFFVTPIFWDYHNVPSSRGYIVDYNVLFYFLELVRGPLLGDVPPASHYLVVAGVTVGGFTLAYASYRRMRRRLAFFV